ncbi:MAG: FlgD immunoglobulin-like domain containing protein [Candidatus Eisenbacteria bacterium]
MRAWSKRSVVCFSVIIILLTASPPVGADFELRTWATTAAAPADGGSHSTSTSFEMVSRLGGPFVGSAESPSFSLWGCSVTPVEGAFIATETEPLCVTLRWTVELLPEIAGFNVYRASAEEGPFERINPGPDDLPAEPSGIYEDRTVWPGCPFWYELRAAMYDGSEDVVGETISLTTDGRLATKLYAASPNPFRDATVIQHDVAPGTRDARLVIYDIAGRAVRSFESVAPRAGRYSVIWDGTNDRGQRVASGVYFCSLEAAGARETRRIVHLR